MSASFDLYLHGILAGVVTFDDQQRTNFQYDSTYINEELLPLSLSLPLKDEPYNDPEFFPFLENLFPEGGIRTRIFEILKTPEGNYERLVQAMGGEVAGAIELHPKGELHRPNETPLKTSLSKTELGQILKEIVTRPFLVDRSELSGQRLSLAGAQNKLPVILRDGDIFEAGAAPSTHIIKPPHAEKRFPALVYNEYACMKAASIAGLDVADVALVDYLNEDSIETDALLITRYDRQAGQRNNQQTNPKNQHHAVKRLHQEDMCQILSIVSTCKYESSGGPKFQDLANVIRKYCTVPVKDLNELLKRIIFSLIIGNDDAHGKNFSLVYSNQDDIRLSPAYDLVCTQVYPDLDKTMAMFIGGKNRLEELSPASLHQLADDMGIKIKPLAKGLLQFCDKALASLELVISELDDCYEEDYKILLTLKKIANGNYQQVCELLQAL